MKSSLLLVISLALIAGLGGCASDVKPADNSCSDQNDIMEAVFRHQFANNASGIQDRAQVFFLSLAEDADPDPGFMARFASNTVPVKPVSQSRLRPNGQVEDASTGDTGLIFRIDRIRMKSEREAQVHGGYYEANVSASGNVYALECENGQWKVGEQAMKWIS